MNPEVYLEMAETENAHWWFVGRRAILSKLLEGMGVPMNSRILEVGCGTGGNLNMLAKFGKVSALEKDLTALKIALNKTNHLYDLKVGCCSNEIPFQGQTFDLICIFDVLEHIENDIETLIILKKMLSKNGQILMTVPAYQWLYGIHDELLHHKRRYTAIELRKKFTLAGLIPQKISYFNTILFPIVAIVRLKDKLFGSTFVTGTLVPTAFINKIFTALLSAERFFLRYFNFTFGVSLICVLTAADEGQADLSRNHKKVLRFG